MPQSHCPVPVKYAVEDAVGVMLYLKDSASSLKTDWRCASHCLAVVTDVAGQFLPDPDSSTGFGAPAQVEIAGEKEACEVFADAAVAFEQLRGADEGFSAGKINWAALIANVKAAVEFFTKLFS